MYVAEVCVWLLTSTLSTVIEEFSTPTSPPMWSECACVAITRCMCVMLRS